MRRKKQQEQPHASGTSSAPQRTNCGGDRVQRRTIKSRSKRSCSSVKKLGIPLVIPWTISSVSAYRGSISRKGFPAWRPANCSHSDEEHCWCVSALVLSSIAHLLSRMPSALISRAPGPGSSLCSTRGRCFRNSFPVFRNQNGQNSIQRSGAPLPRRCFPGELDHEP